MLLDFDSCLRSVAKTYRYPFLLLLRHRPILLLLSHPVLLITRAERKKLTNRQLESEKVCGRRSLAFVVDYKFSFGWNQLLTELRFVLTQREEKEGKTCDEYRNRFVRCHWAASCEPRESRQWVLINWEVNQDGAQDKHSRLSRVSLSH